MEDIVKELLKTTKHIPLNERQSVWYTNYLDKINKDLKNEIYKTTNKRAI